MPFVLAILGAVVGLSLGRYGGWFYGGLAGLALGLIVGTRRRVAQLEAQLTLLQQRPADGAPQPQSAPEPDREEQPQPRAQPGAEQQAPAAPPAREQPQQPGTRPRVTPVFESESLTAARAQAPPQPSPAAQSAIPPDQATPQPHPGPPAQAVPDDSAIPRPSPAADAWLDDGPAPAGSGAGPSMIDDVLEGAKDWLFGGNIMVRVGVILLFFGVAFLLKIAVDNALFPIELRLAAVAAGGIGMLLVGWRLRERKRVYALVLQGGAVGVLYLTIFAALRLYSLVPPGMALVLLIVFAAFSAVLALLQNAPSLAILGASGGFLAPVLTSTGGGSHVQLFAYYVVLNAGILTISWFRAWRLLNLVGFGFTFVIASMWGARYYRPGLFESTEPFLIIFVLMYVAIAVLFALRQPVHLRGLVDGTLVFGVPLVAFGLQAAMLKHSEYGMAYSALVAGGFYVLLAWLLFGRLGPQSRLLAEAFLALGIGFATLSIPLALDAQWTAGAWAMEGAGLIWVGLRQGRFLPRASGYLLQLGGGAALLYAADRMPHSVQRMDALFFGALIVALAGLFSAWYTLRRRDDLHTFEKSIPISLFLWGCVWWFGAFAYELEKLLRDRYLPAAFLVLFAATAMLAVLLRERADWAHMRYLARTVLPFASLVLVASVVELDHPFQHWAWLGWLAVFVAHYMVLRNADVNGEPPIAMLHMLGVWLGLAVCTWEVAWMLDDAVAGEDTWWRIALGLVPAAGLHLFNRFTDRLPWPAYEYPDIYRETAMIPVGIYLWLWVVAFVCLSRGGTAPLPFVPLVNPMDIAVGLTLVLLTGWARVDDADVSGQKWRFRFSPQALAIAAFLWINSMWFRTAHHWLGIRFDLDRMLASQTVQSGLALLWSACGLGSMILGARLGKRAVWLVGAALMVVVVGKLFLVDLSNTGTVARVVSFMGVGALLLVVGYFAPVPPSNSDAEREA